MKIFYKVDLEYTLTWNASSNSSTKFPLLFVGVAIAETGGDASFIDNLMLQFKTAQHKPNVNN